MLKSAKAIRAKLAYVKAHEGEPECLDCACASEMLEWVLGEEKP